jgi:hypothetical protein
MVMVESLKSNDYFSMLATLLSQHASLEQDSAALHNLSALGIAANRPYEWLGLIDSWLFNAVIDITQQRLGDRTKNRSELESGWAVHRSVIGNFGTDCTFRAGVAKVGLGALPPEERPTQT